MVYSLIHLILANPLYYILMLIHYSKTMMKLMFKNHFPLMDDLDIDIIS